MTERYISRDNAIIIAVMSTEYELNNQSIYAMAQKHDASGERTLGCLTKPDRIEENHEAIWTQLMRRARPFSLPCSRRRSPPLTLRHYRQAVNAPRHRAAPKSPQR
jgi:hypothetical protein